MKFEKHLKNTGIYGVIFTAKNGDKYLRAGQNGNVLARVPAGFAPVGQVATRDLEGWINDILIEDAENLHTAELFAAKLEKDGKPKDIRRVWADGDDDFARRRCEIDNTAFGLIERGDDVRIFDPRYDAREIDEDDLEPIDEPAIESTKPLAEMIAPALVILDHDETVVGIILEPWWEN